MTPKRGIGWELDLPKVFLPFKFKSDFNETGYTAQRTKHNFSLGALVPFRPPQDDLFTGLKAGAAEQQPAVLAENYCLCRLFAGIQARGAADGDV